MGRIFSGKFSYMLVGDGLPVPKTGGETPPLHIKTPLFSEGSFLAAKAV